MAGSQWPHETFCLLVSRQEQFYPGRDRKSDGSTEHRNPEKDNGPTKLRKRLHRTAPQSCGSRFHAPTVCVLLVSIYWYRGHLCRPRIRLLRVGRQLVATPGSGGARYHLDADRVFGARRGAYADIQIRET